MKLKIIVKKLLITLGLFELLIIFRSYIIITYFYWSQKMNKQGKPIVVIDHAFVQDIDALMFQARNFGINLIRIPFQPICRVAQLFFSPKIQDGSYYAESMAIPKKKYHIFLNKFLLQWNVQSKICCFLTPSDSFFWIRELITILKGLGIPCIVIDKEGTISPLSMDIHAKQISEFYPFISDAIIVWSERQHTFWKKTGVPEEKIFVEGQSRSDYFVNKKMWIERGKLPIKHKHYILFFTFEVDAYALSCKKNPWINLRRDAHNSLINFAMKHPEYGFVIKTHPQQVDKFEVQAEFEREKLNNIYVFHGADLSRHLIVHSDLVVGFQTTALTESMLAGKNVIYIQWSEDVFEFRDKLIPFHAAQGIHVASTLNEFENLMEAFFNNDRCFIVTDQIMFLRKPFINIFIPNADGGASYRILNRVMKIIEMEQINENHGVLQKSIFKTPL